MQNDNTHRLCYAARAVVENIMDEGVAIGAETFPALRATKPSPLEAIDRHSLFTPLPRRRRASQRDSTAETKVIITALPQLAL